MLAHQIPVILGGGFDPSIIFAEMPGAWLEPRIGQMWQENTGATAITTAGQSVGLILGLDQQQMLASEIIVDGQFANAGASWVLSPGVTANVGLMTFPSTGGYESISQSNVVFSANSVYQLQINGTGTVSYRTGTSDVVTVITLPFSGIFSRTSYANRRVQIFNVAGSAATVTGVSCKQILGNHAAQATAANRPTLQYVNGLPLIRCDNNDFMTVYMPNLGGGVFSSSGSVYFALNTGMSALHNQSIGTSYSAPIQSMDLYGAVIVPSRLSDQREAQLQTYFEKLAGLR